MMRIIVTILFAIGLLTVAGCNQQQQKTETTNNITATTKTNVIQQETSFHAECGGDKGPCKEPTAKLKSPDRRNEPL